MRTKLEANKGKMKKAEQEKIEKKLNNLFEEVKDTFFRVPLSGPEVIWDEIQKSGEGTAFLNWLKLRIGINVPWAQKLAEHANLDDIVKGIFAHEMGHYYLHPTNFSTQLYLSYMAQKSFNDKAQIVYGLYTDFEDNCLVVDNDFEKDQLKSVLKAIWDTGTKSPVEAAIFSAYDKKLNLGLNINISEYKEKNKIQDAIKELEQILITSSEDCGLQYSQMLRFGNAILPLMEGKKIKISFGSGKTDSEQGQDDKRKGSKGAGQPSDGEEDKSAQPGDINDGEPVIEMPPSGSGYVDKDMIDSLPDDLKRKIEEEIRKLITKLPRDFYKELKKHFLGEDQKKQDKQQGIGLGSADIGDAEKEHVEYYKELAKEFGIYVRPKRSLCRSAIEINAGKKDFKPTDSPIGIDLRFSGGRILPNLTKTNQQQKILYPITKETVPRLILYKDASGSMSDPRTSKCYGTIAGTIFILSYLRSHAQVGVALFDSEASELLQSLKEDELIARLCSYKGGGTYVDINQLKKDIEGKKLEYHLPLDSKITQEELKKDPYLRRYLKKQARITGMDKLKSGQMTDFVIITDGGIANIDELISFFKENEECRPTILHTGGYPMNVPGYDGKTSGTYEGITIWKADSREDIIEMTKKTLQRNLLARYTV